MLHYRSLEEVTLPASWLTIGSFDGVHRGHQVILRNLVEEAHKADALAVVLTFFPHPAVVLRDLQGPFYLCHPEERASLLAQLGVDVVITIEFSRQIAEMTAEQFMKLIASHLDLRCLMAGYDFALGKGRQGNLTVLRDLGKQLGYTLYVIDPVHNGGQIISSSQIRQLLQQGEVTSAAKLLGRPYRLGGQVVRGDGRGRQLGIPTANLQVWSQQLLPRSGVYATWADLSNQRLASITNIGFRPTFESQLSFPLVETHILDFNEDIYGANLQLEFLSFLRPEQRFPSAQALLEQIQKDIASAQKDLAGLLDS